MLQRVMPELMGRITAALTDEAASLLPRKPPDPSKRPQATSGRSAKNTEGSALVSGLETVNRTLVSRVLTSRPRHSSCTARVTRKARSSRGR